MSAPKDPNSHEETEELAEKKGVRIKAKENDPSDDVPKLDFATYVISLGQTVQVALGKLPNPLTNQCSVDLPVASQFIDILDLLKQKTAGNLQKDEQKMLDAMIYELKLQFVEIRKEIKETHN